MMKRALPLLPLLALAACTQQVEPYLTIPDAPEAVQKLPAPPQEETPAWVQFGMEQAFYESLNAALQEDQLAKVKELYAAPEAPKPDNKLLLLCCNNHAGRCLQWALKQGGVKPNTSDEYWCMLWEYCCEVDEEDADTVRHVLIPLLKANPALKKKELISPVVIYLAQYGCIKTMRQALDLGVPAEVTDARGRSALDYAHFYEYKDVERELRAHGAKKLTVHTTADAYMAAEQSKFAAEQAKRDKAREERLKQLKPGETLPPEPIYVTPDFIHRPPLP